MKRNYSRLSNRIMRNYILYWLIMAGIFLAIYLIVWFLAGRFIWYPDDPMYHFLKTLENGAPWLIVCGLLLGTFILTYRTIRKSLGYLDVTLDAAKTLSNPEADMITLPADLSDAQNELNLARETFLRNMDAVRDSEKRKNDLIMYLAHDLKTPLASVIGYLNLIRDTNDLPRETIDKYLNLTLDKAERLEDLINEFFEISRFNLTNVTLDYQKVDLTRMLEQTVFEFMPMLQEGNLSCDLKIMEPVFLNCDPDKLQRVFDNILRNALVYAYPDSVITISQKAGPGTDLNNTIQLDFTNQGRTIEPEKLNRIFEQFYRIDAARSSFGETGLGLAIAKQIVELHKGSITAKSENNLTTFSVTLPIL